MGGGTGRRLVAWGHGWAGTWNGTLDPARCLTGHCGGRVWLSFGVGDSTLSTRDSHRFVVFGIPQLPQFPGDDFYAHDAAAWLEQEELRLGRLLHVAQQGHEPAAASAIRDIDLRSLPELPHDHRDHHRRQETRIKVQAQNEANAFRRFTIITLHGGLDRSVRGAEGVYRDVGASLQSAAQGSM